MRSRYLYVILGLSCLSTVSHADDSIVNLSVLDNLSADTVPSSTAIAPQGPLFPVIYPDKEDNQRVSQKRKSVKKKSLKAKKIKKQAPNKQVAKEKIEATQIVPADSLDVQKAQEVKDQEPANKVIELPQKPKIEYTAPSLDKKEELTAKPIEEPKTQNPQPNMPEKSSQPESESLLKENEVENTASSALPKVDDVQSGKVEQSKAPEINNIQAPAMDNKPSLLVDNKAENKAASDSVEVKNEQDIYFAAETEDLTAEQKAQLDKLVASFENPKENKIAIYAYNYVNGEDAFRRKRIALNRAVNIRSYLLLKGYKNYSMKVINIEEVNGKENCVHVEELK